MSFENLITILAQNEDVGKNVSSTDMQITIANVKLRKNNIPGIPADFGELLKKYNGLSCEGNTIFGVATGTMFFPDLVNFNIELFENEETSCIVLGQDEDFYLIYDEDKKTYRIVDKYDFEERLQSQDMLEVITWILKI